ncbi:SNARE [Hexamita inflata]|uniref:Putative n=1 Tax=Hexamita inflata TaxID=28002 RepID=A0AA86P4D6_9EUKA|nr:SNARE [Hexamita inflata]
MCQYKYLYNSTKKIKYGRTLNKQLSFRYQLFTVSTSQRISYRIIKKLRNSNKRNRKLNKIVADSEDLSAMAKEFANDTKKLARCKCFGI